MNPALWRWTPEAVRSDGDMRAYVEVALPAGATGLALPFGIVERTSNTVIGSTRYANLVPAHRRLEIGWTWIGCAWQRTAVNTECKLLLLGHAFERLGMARVEIKTDALNERSRAAILRLGAREERTLRRHVLTGSGRWRDTVY